MMKMLIKLDEDKIRRENKYDINKINAYLTSAFEKRSMTKHEDDWYINVNSHHYYRWYRKAIKVMLKYNRHHY